MVARFRIADVTASVAWLDPEAALLAPQAHKLAQSGVETARGQRDIEDMTGAEDDVRLQGPAVRQPCRNLARVADIGLHEAPARRADGEALGPLDAVRAIDEAGGTGAQAHAGGVIAGIGMIARGGYGYCGGSQRNEDAPEHAFAAGDRIDHEMRDDGCFALVETIVG